MSSTTTTWITDTNTKSGSATTYTDTVSSLRLVGGEGEDAILRLFADEGDDNADQWRIVSKASNNKLNFMSYASGAWSNVLSLFGSGTASSVYAALPAEAKLGIGTTTPDHPLEISAANTTAINVANITDNSVYGLHIEGNTGDNDGSGSVIKLSTNGDGCMSAIAHLQEDENSSNLVFYTDNDSGTLVEGMRITPDSHVGIGINSPTGALDVSETSTTNAGIRYRPYYSYGGCDQIISIVAATLASIAAANQARITFTIDDLNVDSADASATFGRWFYAEAIIDFHLVGSAPAEEEDGDKHAQFRFKICKAHDETAYYSEELLQSASSTGAWVVMALSHAAVNAESDTEVTIDIDNPSSTYISCSAMVVNAHNCSAVAITSVAA